MSLSVVIALRNSARTIGRCFVFGDGMQYSETFDEAGAADHGSNVSRVNGGPTWT